MTRTAVPFVAIYADESCLGNGREGSNPGGAGGLIEYSRGAEIVRRDYWIAEPGTTNNRMALRSVIEAFRSISRRGNSYRVVFTSDSKYIVMGMNEWVHTWQARGWKKKNGPILNLELWKEALAAASPHEFRFLWVHGHAGHPQNEYANFLATRAAKEQSNSGGLRDSGFSDWLADQKEGRLYLKDTAPFPDLHSFQPSKRAWTT